MRTLRMRERVGSVNMVNVKKLNTIIIVSSSLACQVISWDCFYNDFANLIGFKFPTITTIEFSFAKSITKYSQQITRAE